MAMVVALAAGAAVRAAEQPFLSTGLAGQSLAPRAEEPLKLTLALPNSEDWSQANISRLVIWTPGNQKSIVPDKPAAGLKELSYTFKEPGYAMIILSAGPATAKDTKNAWQRTPYCTKLVLRVGPKEGEPRAQDYVRDPGLTGKVGQKIEVVPYFSPVHLLTGDDLPVRVYFDNGAQSGATVVAIRPDGSVDTQTSNATGIANFRITLPGRWIIRYQKEVAQEGTYTGELVFEVPAGSRQEGGQS